MDPAHDILRDLVVIFGVAVVVVVLFSRFRMPSIAGLLVAGVVVGPHALGLAKDSDTVAVLAEVGVVLLLFTLGLEFSLARLRSIWRMVLIGGALQVGLTGAAAAGVALLLGLPVPAVVLAAFMVALSSTAIVLRALAERAELETLHGRLMIGVLIFQDLCVVPMMLTLPVLAGGSTSAAEVGGILGKTALVVVGVLLGARLVAPRILGLVARSRSREAFVMATVVTCLGIAWLTSLSGLSLALGAFLAGLVVSETEFGNQAMADVLPFRDTLIGLFFVSVGMLLDLQYLRDHFGTVLLLTAGVLLLKAFLMAVVAVLMRFPLRVAVLAGLGLAQVGEFSLVLADVASDTGLVDRAFLAAILNSAVLTMLITPLLARAAPHVASGLGKLRPLERMLGFGAIEDAAPARRALADHVVVAGYGVGGRVVAAALRRCKVPFVVLELNAESVKQGRAGGDPVYYGDATAAEVLHGVGLDRAMAFLVLVSDAAATERSVRAARAMAPGLVIVARTRLLADADFLDQAGATVVVSEEFESSVEALARVLRGIGIPRAIIGARVAEARLADRLRRERGMPPMSPVEAPDLSHEVITAPLALEAGDWATDRTLEEAGLGGGEGAAVAALMRGGVPVEVTGDLRMARGDVLHLRGERDVVTRAFDLLREGPG